MFHVLTVRSRAASTSLGIAAKRHARLEKPAPAQRLVSDLGNIRSIVNHFCPRIQSWSQAHNVAVLTPPQVLAVVRDNYKTLNLKLMDNLDQFVPFQEGGMYVAVSSAVLAEVVAANADIEIQVQTIVITR